MTSMSRLAFDTQLRTMALREPLRQAKAQARSGANRFACRSGAIEAIEDAWLVLRCDSDARVLHNENDAMLLRYGAQRYRSARRSEFARVLKKDRKQAHESV